MSDSEEYIPFDFLALNDPRLLGWIPDLTPYIRPGAIMSLVSTIEANEGESFDDGVFLLGKFQIEFEGKKEPWHGTFHRQSSYQTLSDVAEFIVGGLGETDPEKLESSLLKYAKSRIAKPRKKAAATPDITDTSFEAAIEESIISITAYDQDGWPLGQKLAVKGIELDFEDLRKAVRAITCDRIVRNLTPGLDRNLQMKLERLVRDLTAGAYQCGRAFRQAELKSEHQRAAEAGRKMAKDKIKAQKKSAEAKTKYKSRAFEMAKEHRLKSPEAGQDTLSEKILSSLRKEGFSKLPASLVKAIRAWESTGFEHGNGQLERLSPSQSPFRPKSGIR